MLNFCTSIYLVYGIHITGIMFYKPNQMPFFELHLIFRVQLAPTKSQMNIYISTQVNKGRERLKDRKRAVFIQNTCFCSIVPVFFSQPLLSASDLDACGHRRPEGEQRNQLILSPWTCQTLHPAFYQPGA